MSEFWFAVLCTCIVNAITVLLDFLVARFIIAARCLAAISESRTIAQTRRRLTEYKAQKTAALTWGSDLATVAFVMDLTALIIWVSQPQLFPFFSKFNTASISWEIPVWFVLLGLHVILLVVSIIFKHLHADAIGHLKPESVPNFLTWSWARQCKWMLAESILGFVALLSGIITFTNAL